MADSEANCIAPYLMHACMYTHLSSLDIAVLSLCIHTGENLETYASVKRSRPIESSLLRSSPRRQLNRRPGQCRSLRCTASSLTLESPSWRMLSLTTTNSCLLWSSKLAKHNSSSNDVYVLILNLPKGLF